LNTKQIKINIGGQILERLILEQTRTALSVSSIVTNHLDRGLPSLADFEALGLREPPAPAKPARKPRAKKKAPEPPTRAEVEEKFAKDGYAELADGFWRHYTEASWIDVNGKQITRWRVSAANWITRNKARTGVALKTASPAAPVGEIEL
jgi:hypothetical protein